MHMLLPAVNFKHSVGFNLTPLLPWAAGPQAQGTQRASSPAWFSLPFIETSRWISIALTPRRMIGGPPKGLVIFLLINTGSLDQVPFPLLPTAVRGSESCKE